MPEEESKQVEASNSAGEKAISEEVQEVEAKNEEESEESLNQVPDHPAPSSKQEEEERKNNDQEKEENDDAETESKPTAANSEWEQLDLVSISPPN